MHYFVVGEGFEVNLDKRKLRTPSGKVLNIPTEPLALAVASEWLGQKDTIKRHMMHLVSVFKFGIAK